MCSTVFVLPPIAMSRTIELSIDSAVTISRGNRPWPGALAVEVADHRDDPLGGRRKSRFRSALVARSVPLVGRAMPSASHRQFMLLAVNMPEQEPHVGQPAFSSAESSSAESLPSCLAAAPTKTSIRSTVLPSAVLPGLHRPAADEERGDVAAHGGHEHAGHDLVAVGDADHAVEAMGLEHRLDGVGDDLAAGQRVFHARVPHRDAVVDADRVEHERHPARLADALLDELAHLVQVDVAGNDVGVAVADRR